MRARSEAEALGLASMREVLELVEIAVAHLC